MVQAFADQSNQYHGPAKKQRPDAMVGQQQNNCTFKPTPADVIAAVGSLYEDQLKPFGRIVLRRLGELEADRRLIELEAKKTAGVNDAETNGAELIPRIDTKRLRKLCDTCQDLHVQVEEGGEYSVFLVAKPALFIDASSPLDTYPAELWADMSTYFQNLNRADAPMPGGRYACAQLLAARGLPFLANRSLGEISHIIALAVSQKKILGYANGRIVPFGYSETGLKEHCAACQKPVCNSKKPSSEFAVAGWEDAQACLKELLRTAAREGPGNIPLPNIKRLFQSRFNLELSETALGHSRVFDLLQDQRFHHICRVHRHGNTYVVVPSVINSGLASDHAPAVAPKFSCLSTSPLTTRQAPYMPAPMMTQDTLLPPMVPMDMMLMQMPPPAAPSHMMSVTMPTGTGIALPPPMIEFEQSSWPAKESTHCHQDGSDQSTVDDAPELGSTLNTLSSFGSTVNSLNFGDDSAGLTLHSSSDFGDSPFALEFNFSEMLAAAEVETICGDDIACVDDVADNVEVDEISTIKGTFIHIASPTNCAARRTHSVPKNMRIVASKRSCSPSHSRSSWSDEERCDISTDAGTCESIAAEIALPTPQFPSTASEVDANTAAPEFDNDHYGVQQGGRGWWGKRRYQKQQNSSSGAWWDWDDHQQHMFGSVDEIKFGSVKMP